MIDSTCCFANNLKPEAIFSLSEYSKNILANEFETAISDGYIRFLAALTNEQDAAAADVLIETKNKLGNTKTKIKIEAVIERILLSPGDKREYIKNRMINFDGIIVYDETEKFYNINHYLLYYSTRVILLYGDAEEKNKSDYKIDEDNKIIDDFFVASMLYKDVKKIFI